MVQRVLLTGIGGSIGCHMMARIFGSTDWEIVGIDSFRHKGLTDRIDYFIDQYPEWKSRLQIFTHDLTAPISDILLSRIGHVDYIISMAALSDVEDSIENPELFIIGNVQIVTTMLQFARKVKPKAFVQISTDEVYGPSGSDQQHVEWATILPSNPYAASKAAQEAIAIAYWRSYSVPLIITNTMNNFGEMQQPKKFPAMVQSKVSNGEQVIIHGNMESIGSRYYIHSNIFADAVLYILQNTTPYLHKDGEIDKPDRYNIVGSKRLNNLELAAMIANCLGKDLTYKLVDFHAARPGHDRHYGLDGTKLDKLGWKPQTDFRTTLENTLDWTQNHPEWLA